VRIRVWRASDFARLRHLGPRLSRKTLRSRFWAGVPALPQTYLGSIATRWPHDWDAVVAIRDGQFVGWAEFGRNAPGSADADAGFCVIDDEQGHGTGTALLAALVRHAERAGISALHADIAADNTAAVHAWSKATGSETGSVTLGPDGYRATIRMRRTVTHAA